jgi:hypothetical protein
MLQKVYSFGAPPVKANRSCGGRLVAEIDDALHGSLYHARGIARA